MVLWSPLGKGLEPEVCLHPHLAHGGDRHPSRAIIQVILSRSEHLFPFDQRPSPPDTCTPPPPPPATSLSGVGGRFTAYTHGCTAGSFSNGPGLLAHSRGSRSMNWLSLGIG